MKTFWKLVLTLCLAAAAPGLWAVDYSFTGSAPHPLGVSRTAVTSGGLAFVLDGPEAVSADQEARLQVLLRTFASWTDIKIKSLRIQLANGQAEAVVVPEALDASGVDAAAFMPSGMWFVARDYLEFDFRLAVKSVFVRMQGAYFDFKEFKNRLKEAIDNPVAYVQKNDPLYLFSRLTELQKTVDKLKLDLATLQYAGTALANRDFFGGMHPLDPAEVDKVLALKAANPGKLRKAVYAEYQAQGGKLSQAEVYLVMAVWYKDFSD